MTKDGRITSGRAARILGVSQRTLNRYHDAGLVTAIDQVPGPKGARLYDEGEIRKFAQARIVNQRAALEQKLAAMGGAA